MNEPQLDAAMPFSLPFFRESARAAVVQLCREGGLLVAPSGPGLAEIDRNPAYWDALRRADLLLMDSGALVLAWALLTGERLPRLSGYRFFDRLMRRTDIDWQRNSLWVLPSNAEADRWCRFLAERGLHLPDQAVYIAPRYDPLAVADPVLLQRLRERPVDWVMIQIGGGVQEPLGVWLKDRLETRPAIVCTGAAMAFVSGSQVRIPWWADRWCLGWLMRMVSVPRLYGRRYLRAMRLFTLLYHYHRT